MKYIIKTFNVRLEVRDPGYKPDKVSCALDAIGVFRALYQTLDGGQEHLSALFLDGGGKVMAVKILASGGMGACTVDPKILFRAALLCGAVSFILCHNHPANGIEPSSEDRQTTRILYDAGRLIGVTMLDHIIIPDEGPEYYSFQESAGTGKRLA